MPPLPAWLITLLRTLIVICLPVVLVLLNVRVMMSQTFLNYEYAKPDFPADVYGFTQADRLRYAPIALAYLFNNEGIDFLGRQTFDDGARQYNERELKHMADVKVVTRGAMTVLTVGAVLSLVAAVALAWQPATRPALRAGLVGRAGLTVGILLALVLYLLINFNTFFIQFHQVFFQGDSWLFEWSDTLIRLFPVRFWSDGFTLIGVATLAEGIVVGLLAWFGLRGA